MDCKDRRQYTLYSSPGSLQRSPRHCLIRYRSKENLTATHPQSRIRTTNSNETPANVIRENLLKVPDSVKSSLPAPHNMKKPINDHRKKTRGCPASNETFTANVSFPLSGRDDSDGGLFVLDESCLAILNKSLLYSYSKALHCQTSEKSEHCS